MQWRLDSSPVPGRTLLAQWTATGFVGLASLGLVLFLGRMLGPRDFGFYNFALTLGAFWAVVLDWGYSVLVFREFTSPSGRWDRDELLASALGHLIWALSLGFVAVLILPQGALVWALICFGALQVSRLVSARLKGLGSFEAEALWQIGVRALSGLMIVGVVLVGWTYPGAIFAAWALGILVMCFWTRVGRALIRKPNFTFKIDLLRAGFPLMVIELATLLYFRLDIVVIEGVVGAHAVGLYAAAYRLVEGVTLPVAPLSQIWFRDLRFAATAGRGFGQLLIQRAGLLTGLSLIPVVIFVFWARPIISLLFGAEYADSAAILVWLAPSLIFIFPNAVLTQACLAANQERAYAVLACGAGAANLGLNLLLLPRLGPKGAALATVVTEAMLGLGLILALRRYQGRKA